MPVGNKSFNLNNVQVADIKAKTQFIVKTEEGGNEGVFFIYTFSRMQDVLNNIVQILIYVTKKA